MAFADSAMGWVSFETAQALDTALRPDGGLRIGVNFLPASADKVFSMTEPLYLQSEEALLAYFKRFLKDKSKASRLDGAEGKAGVGPVVAVFRFSIDGKRYKCLGSMTRRSIEEFVSIAEEHGDASMALKTFGEGASQTLVLSTRKGPEGFTCLPFIEKAKDSLKRVA